MIHRIVYHADVLNGASTRLRNRGIGTLPSIRTTSNDPPGRDCPQQAVEVSGVVDQQRPQVKSAPTVRF